MSNQSIIIVEDDAKILLFFSVNLSQRGYTVRGTATAEDALALLRTEAPALILLDLNLPQMGGLDLLDLLLQRRNQPAIPVVIVSASAEQNKQSILATYPFVQEVLSKPVNLSDLLEIVLRCIGK